MGLGVEREEIKKMRKAYEQEFFANVLYRTKASKECRNEDWICCRKMLIDRTKKLIKKGSYTEAISNIKILYYERSIGTNLNQYKDIKIDVTKINKDFLDNQKLLLNDFFGKYKGFSSMNYFNMLVAISVGSFTGIFTNILMEIIKTIKPESNLISNILSIIVVVIIYIILLVFSLRVAKKSKISLEKETFFGLCLEAIDQLINFYDTNILLSESIDN